MVVMTVVIAVIVGLVVGDRSRVTRGVVGVLVVAHRSWRTSADILADDRTLHSRRDAPRPAVAPAEAAPPPPDPGLVASLRGLDRNGRLLFAMRTLRMFGYGFLAVVLVLYLAAVGLDPLAIGIVLTLTLIGDTIISLWLTTHADRLGRRRVLVAGAVLMILAGIVFAFTSLVPLLILAGAIGVVSPTGNEVGPFLAIEQAALTQTVPDRRRTATFAWYNLVGYVATATGALGAGLLSQALIDGGTSRRSTPTARSSSATRSSASRWWSASGGSGPAIEAPPAKVSTDGIRRRFGLGRSKGVGAQAVGPVLARRLRWRLHPAEPDGLLVPHPVRRRPGAPRR